MILIHYNLADGLFLLLYYGFQFFFYNFSRSSCSRHVMCVFVRTYNIIHDSRREILIYILSESCKTPGREDNFRFTVLVLLLRPYIITREDSY